MAISARAIRAGAAYVELLVNDNKLVRGLKSAQRKLQNFGNGLKAIGKTFVGFGAAGLAAFAPTIKAASNLEETMNKFNVVFGDNAKSVKEWADAYSKQVGRSQRQTADFLASNQDLLVPIGIDPKTATEMSKQLTELAVDLASFNNMDDASVLRDLQAALTGSSETMKKYGVIVNVAAVNQELLNQGLDPKAATEAQKAMARLAIFMRDTTAAQGDAIRSAGSFANQLKAVQGQLEDTAAIIGGALLPVVTPFLTRARELAGIIAEWIDQNQGLVVTLAKLAAGVVAGGIALYGLGTVFGALSSIAGVFLGALMAVGSAIGVMGTLLSALLTPVGAVVAGVGLLAAAFIDWGSVGESVTQFLSEAFQVLKEDAITSFQGISDAMAAGDLTLAAQILWASLKVEWERGLLFLKKLWSDFLDTSIGKLVNWQLEQWGIIWEVGQFFGKVLGQMFDGFMKFANAIQKAWNSVSKFFRKTWAKVKGVVAGTDSAAEIKRIESESGSAAISGTFNYGDSKQSALDQAIAERDKLIEDAKKALEAKNKDNKKPNPNSDLENNLKERSAELKRLQEQRNQALSDLKDQKAGSMPDLNASNLEAGAMAFDSFMGDLRNTALELGTAEAQSAIIDALTGRNNPQKDIAKATQETATNTKKTQKDVARQTTLMQSGVRLIVEDA